MSVHVVRVHVVRVHVVRGACSCGAWCGCYLLRFGFGCAGVLLGFFALRLHVRLHVYVPCSVSVCLWRGCKMCIVVRLLDCMSVQLWTVVRRL